MKPVSFSLLCCLSMSLAACGAAESDASTAPEPIASSTEDTPPTSRSDSMMVVRVVIDVKPESTEAFVAYLTEEAERVRELEGCLRYQLFQDPAVSTRFLLYEEWASAETFEAYQSSDTLRESFAVLGPMMAGPPDSQYFASTPTRD